MTDQNNTGIRFDQAGRACFVPGTTPTEAKAREPQKRDNLRLHVNVNVEALDAAQTAMDSASTHFCMVADAMELVGDFVADDPGRVSSKVSSTLYLIARGMRHLDETDGKALSQFGLKIGRAARDDFDFLLSDQKGGVA